MYISHKNEIDIAGLKKLHENAANAAFDGA